MKSQEESHSFGTRWRSDLEDQQLSELQRMIRHNGTSLIPAFLLSKKGWEAAQETIDLVST